MNVVDTSGWIEFLCRPGAVFVRAVRGGESGRKPVDLPPPPE